MITSLVTFVAKKTNKSVEENSKGIKTISEEVDDLCRYVHYCNLPTKRQPGQMIESPCNARSAEVRRLKIDRCSAMNE